MRLCRLFSESVSSRVVAVHVVSDNEARLATLFPMNLHCRGCGDGRPIAGRAPRHMEYLEASHLDAVNLLFDGLFTT